MGDLFSLNSSLARYRFENKSPKKSCAKARIISWIACLPRWRVNEHAPFFDTQSKNGVLEAGCPVGMHTLAMTQRNTSKVKRCNKNVKNRSPFTVHSSLINETVFSRFTPHFSPLKKPAFTMAEVLITLGIIGIIAAMTLPTVINNARNKELEARFKQAYSLVYQAVLLMGNDDPQLWQTYCSGGTRDNAQFFIKDFSKYFQVVTKFDNKTTSKRDLRLLGYKQEYFYSVEKGRKKFNPDSYNDGAFAAKNGMIIFNSGCWWGYSLDFVVDTNGHKGPNKFGYDVFYFQIAQNNQLLPSSINSSFQSAHSEGAGCCSFTGTTDGSLCDSSDGGYGGGSWSDNGTACSKFALMDRFPGDEGKPYWKNLPQP